MRDSIYELPVVCSSNIQKFPYLSNETAINCYPFYDAVSGKKAQYRYSGYKKILDFVGAENLKGRPGGFAKIDQYAFVVIGALVFRIEQNLTYAQIGVLGTTEGYVSMCITAQYLTIVDGTGKWVYDIILGTFSAITEGPTNPTYVTQMKGFVFFNDANKQAIYQSAQNQPSTINALSFEQIDYNTAYQSYNLIAMSAINGNLLCFTSGFIETLQEVSRVGFTFDPDLNLTYEYGIVNAGSLAKGAASLKTGQKISVFCIFFAQEPTTGLYSIMMTDGGQPITISTSSIEYRLSKLSNPADNISFIFSDNGQTFYQITFLTDNLTLVYNVNQKAWFDVQYFGARHPAQAMGFFIKKRLFISAYDNGLYEMSEDYNTFNNFPFTCTIITPNFQMANYVKGRANTLKLNLLTGTQNPNVKPKLILWISNDGGVSFRAAQGSYYPQSGDRIGVMEYRELGSSSNFSFKIEFQGDSDFMIISAQLSYSVPGGSRT